MVFWKRRCNKKEKSATFLVLCLEELTLYYVLSRIIEKLPPRHVRPSVLCRVEWQVLVWVKIVVDKSFWSQIEITFSRINCFFPRKNRKICPSIDAVTGHPVLGII